MKKIIFALCLASTFCWSQKLPFTDKIKGKTENTKYVSLDSLKVVLDYNIEKLEGRISSKSASKLIYPFLKIIKNQKKIHKLRNENLKSLDSIEIITMLDLMVYVHAKNHSVDSIHYYQKKILKLTKDRLIIAESNSRLAFAYSLNNMMVEAIKIYEKSFEFWRNYNNKHKIIHTLVNIIDCLIKLGSFEHAQHHVHQLSQEINAIKRNSRYEEYKELYKVMQSKTFIGANKYKEALQILTKVDTTKITSKKIKVKYFSVSSEANKALKNFTIGEMYLDKAYRFTKNNIDISNVKYYIEKLSYALHYNDSKKADSYYEKINKILLKNDKYKNIITFNTLSLYHASKKEFQKAFVFLEKATLLKNNFDRTTAKNKSDVDIYFIKFNKELQAMKQLADSKDEVIIKNRANYTDNTTILLFIFSLLTLTLFTLFYLTITFRKRAQFKIKLKRLSEKTILDSKQVFLENMSHEIRTPITSILGYLALLKENNLNTEKRKKYTDRAYSNAQKMITPLNSFLTLLKAEKGKPIINKKIDIPFNSFMKDIMSNYIADLEIKNICFYYKTNAKDSLNINYDFESLKIILNNLISNAIKYSNANKNIYLNIHFIEESIEITITDEGFGISEEDKEMIFTRFYQTKQNSTTGGFGIGLALLAELVNKLNGVVRVESEINVGSIFYVNLPYELNNFSLHTNSLENKFDLISIEKKSWDDTTKTTSYPKVLIVDDNLEMIAYLKEIFLDILECTFSFNGAEALEQVKEQDFDLIISDLRMPLLNGAEFKEALNKINEKKDIPFIMITAVFYNKLEDLKNNLNLNEYLEKPFTKDELLSRVQYILERTMNRKKIVNLESVNQTEVNFDSSSSELVEKIKESILSNLTNPEFNVTMLSKICGYEQKKLNQILKSKLGLSIVNIILEVRLLKAYEYIVKNRFSTINEVMYAVGINSRSYFSKKFEERFGLKVGQLRKKNLLL
jgi:signal transduction histidine kinase/CheY-like chemotaxis protein/AraC-like DNA-binding protein